MSYKKGAPFCTSVWILERSQARIGLTTKKQEMTERKILRRMRNDKKNEKVANRDRHVDFGSFPTKRLRLYSLTDKPQASAFFSPMAYSSSLTRKSTWRSRLATFSILLFCFIFQHLRSIIFSISGQPNASLRAFKNPNGSAKGCALFVRHWNFLQYGTFRCVRHSTMLSALCLLRMN